MKETKYIPGDLVMVKKAALQFARNKVFKVISSHNGFILHVVILGDNETYRIYGDSVRPIPITSEILEKNGWDKELSENVTWYKYRTDKSSLYICKDSFNNKDWLVCVALDKHYIANINYVHQLQHLLFGLGLNLEMKV
jgi:hypothetical protein